MSAKSSPARRSTRGGPRSALLVPLVVVIVLTMLGSAGYIGWVVLNVEDQQIPLLAAGFVVLGVSFAVAAIGSLVGMWRAASGSRSGGALAFALLGGLCALGAIGSFTVSALLALVSSS